MFFVCFQGTVVVQPEDATDSPFQGPEFFPAESSNSGLLMMAFRSVCDVWGCDEGEKYSHSSNASNKFTIRRISNANGEYKIPILILRHVEITSATVTN